MRPNAERLAIAYPADRSARPTPLACRQRVTARCTGPACGVVSELEVGEDLRRYLEGASRSRLEDQLRCTCGGRTGRLEFGGVAPLSNHGRMYLFLI